MEDKRGDRFWLFLVPCWALSAFVLWFFLASSGWPPMMPATIWHLAYLILSLILMVLPFVSRISLGRLLSIERELKKTREDVNYFKNETRQMFSLLSAVSATASNTVTLLGGNEHGAVEAKAGRPEPRKERRDAMEYKILNTLWNKQVGKFPDVNVFFTFRLNRSALEFLAFREAGNRLMVEGLISEADNGQFHLTWQGLEYCLKNHADFPTDMWFEPEPIDEAKIEKAKKKLTEVIANP